METNKKNIDRNPNNSNKFMIGILLIVAGAILIIQKTTILPDGLDYFIDDVIFSWQMLLVAIGLIVMGSRGHDHGAFDARNLVHGQLLAALDDVHHHVGIGHFRPEFSAFLKHPV